MILDNPKFVEQGLTYDDVLLVPAYSDVLPRDVKINSYFSKNIPLNLLLLNLQTKKVDYSIIIFKAHNK